MLFIARDKFPPFRVDITVLFAQELVKKGYSIDWIFQARENTHKSYSTKWSDGTAYIGATRDGVGIVSKALKNLFGFINDLKVFKILRKNRYDAVVVRDKVFSALAAMLAAKFNKTKFILWLSYPFVENDLYQLKQGTAPFPLLYLARGKLGQFVLYRILWPMADHVFVQSSYMQKMISEKYNLPIESMTPVPMGVSLDTIPDKEIESAAKDVQKTNDVVYLGTLMKTRKLDLLVRAFAMVKKKCPNARLVFIGSGNDPTDEELLKQEIENCQLIDSVQITGHLEQSEAWKLVKNASVCVSPICPSPILDCGSPTKLIEYMALGKAVVANDHPEQKEILQECRAGLCVSWNEEEFADAIIFLINNPEEAVKMGNTGQNYITAKRNYNILASIVDEKLSEIINP